MRREHLEDDFKEMELWEHLAELRQRLIRSGIYVVVGLVLAWLIYGLLSKVFFAPLHHELAKHPDWKLVFHSFTGPFMLQLEVSLVSGLILAIPLITFELWGFVSPGLTRNERKVCSLIFPLSVGFFFVGVAVGYVIMQPSLEWFLSFMPPDTVLLQEPTTYIMFMVKLVVAFGVCFQLPLILMVLSYIGIISSRTLKEQWRIAVFACFVLGAVATPGGDLFSPAVLSTALVILYVASIGLCGIVEKFRSQQERRLAIDSSA